MRTNVTLGFGPVKTFLIGPARKSEKAQSSLVIDFLPGQKLDRFVSPFQQVMLVDEAAFTSGAWRSFGGRFDTFLVEKYREILQQCSKVGIPVISVLDHSSPRQFQGARAMGPVYVTSDQAFEFIEKEWQ